MTQEEKLKLVREWYNDQNATQEEKHHLLKLVSELEKNDDEKIKNELIDFIKRIDFIPEKSEKLINWIKKQCVDISSFPEEQRRYMEKYINLDKATLVKLLAERDGNINEILNCENNEISALEVWKDMRLEVYQQASNNRHEPNCSDDSTKMFSLTDIDEIFEKVVEKQCNHNEQIFWEKCNHCEYFDGYDVCLHKKNFGSVTDESKENCKNSNFFIEKHIEPKFKVGDFIKHDTANIIRKVVSINNDGSYDVVNIKSNIEIKLFTPEQNFHLWSIKDAKDGDVLVTSEDEYPFIFKKLDESHTEGYIAYCGIDSLGDFVDSISLCWGNVETKPATKEQTDFLFQKMKEAGYGWDSEKKELKKLEQDQSKQMFKVGDWIVNKQGEIARINQVGTRRYYIEFTNGYKTDPMPCFVDEKFHLWTIRDVKDGDTLVVGDEDGEGVAICGKDDAVGNNNLYCVYDDENGFIINVKIAKECLLHPANKEQRDTLFARMKESGYLWDVEKKELRRIEDGPSHKEMMIKWNGDNLKEVLDFTGKCKNFDNWFASFADYEKYVHDHNNIFKLFNEDGSHYEVPIGSWIVKTPDGYNVAYARAAYRQNSAWSEKYIADVFEKTGLAKIAREQANDRLTCALQDVLLELSKSTPTSDDWVEDYWQHHKVNNPSSYDGGDEIQFDHDGFLRFCQTYFHKEWDFEKIA